MRLHDIPRPDPVIPEWMRVVYAYYTTYLPRQNWWTETLDRWEIYRTPQGRLRLRARITNTWGHTYRNYWTQAGTRHLRAQMRNIRIPETIPGVSLHPTAY